MKKLQNNCFGISTLYDRKVDRQSAEMFSLWLTMKSLIILYESNSVVCPIINIIIDEH